MLMSYNNILLSRGLAYIYDGGKKKNYKEWYKKN